MRPAPSAVAGTVSLATLPILMRLLPTKAQATPPTMIFESFDNAQKARLTGGDRFTYGPKQLLASCATDA